jgi:hypothetical protein
MTPRRQNKASRGISPIASAREFTSRFFKLRPLTHTRVELSQASLLHVSAFGFGDKLVIDADHGHQFTAAKERSQLLIVIRVDALLDHERLDLLIVKRHQNDDPFE